MSPHPEPDLAAPPLGRAAGILILLVAGVFALGLWDRIRPSHAQPVATFREAPFARAAY